MTYSTGPGWEPGDTSLRIAKNRIAGDQSPRIVAPGQPIGRDSARAQADRGSSGRLYHVSARMPDGAITEFDHRAPGDLQLEHVCARVARGTLIATANGEVAIEDLCPGDQVKTRDNGYVALSWIASCTLAPGGGTEPEKDFPLRIKAESLGLSRPSHDLLVSPRFRYLSNHPSCAQLYGSPETLAPIVDLLDGETVLRVQPSPGLRFFNLMFDRHQIILANRLETESYHPGEYGVSMLTMEQISHLRRILPHLDGDLGRLGPVARPPLRSFRETQPRRAG